MLYTYSPKDVLINIGGIHQVTGLADGVFVSIKRNIKAMEKARAMDGEVARLYPHEDGWTVELSIMQTSPSNNILGAIYNLDCALKIGKFPFSVKDTKGQTSFFAATAWVEESPAVTFSTGMEIRTWTIACTGGAMIYGGNGESGLLESGFTAGSALLSALKDYGVL